MQFFDNTRIFVVVNSFGMAEWCFGVVGAIIGVVL